VASEGTAAAENKVGELRRDPFAMLPFCGYNMGDYFAHWLKIGASTDAAKLPKIYFVNWFRKNDEGNYVWPGFGENSRVLKWISERLAGTAAATETAIGLVPTRDALDTDGLDISDESLELLLTVDAETWREEAALVKPHYERFGDHLPAALWDELAKLEQRLG
jgi:phosphoenolpyruvate carboxykinase (GTP)